MDNFIREEESVKDFLLKNLEGQKEYVDFLTSYARRIRLYQEGYISKTLVPIPLIAGKSGVGKTYGIKLLCEKLKIKCVIMDSSCITKSGYKGQSVSDLLAVALKNAHAGDLAIVLFDEIDKCGLDYNSISEIDSSLVYNEFLKVIDEPVEDWTGQAYNKLLFAFAGSFEQLPRLIHARTHDASLLSTANTFYGSTYSAAQSSFTYRQLNEYGLSNEFLGRITTYIQLNDIQLDAYKNLLNDKQDLVLKDINKYLLSIGIPRIASITESAKQQIIELAKEEDTGMRSVKKIVNTKVFDAVLNAVALYDLSQSSSSVDFKNGIFQLVCSDTAEKFEEKEEEVEKWIG